MKSIGGFVVGVLVFFLLTTAACFWLLHPEQTLGESAVDATVITAIWSVLMAAWTLWERRRDRTRTV